MKIVTIDCDYLFPRFAASYLLIEAGRAIVIETGTAHSVPRILDALRGEELGPENVDFVIVTHAHLDHAGGASELMKRCPNAKLLAHPRAARHLGNPSKLVASATQVYGEADFKRLYGRIDPIPEHRIQSMDDGSELSWGGGQLRFLHTLGHAKHHFSVLLSEGGSPQAIFTGDSFGVCYPDLQRANEPPMIIPSTSPTDFDAPEARASVRKIAAAGAPVAYPTHFGPIRDIDRIREAATQLIQELDFSEALLNEAIQSAEPDDRLEAFCRERIGQHMEAVFAQHGRRWDSQVQKILELDLDLNAQGIAHIAAQRRKSA